jgi:hypothetical protein
MSIDFSKEYVAREQPIEEETPKVNERKISKVSDQEIVKEEPVAPMGLDMGLLV